MLLNDMHEDWNKADNDTRDSNIVLHTDGNGLWSQKAAAVRITDMQLSAYDNQFGELRVYFNTNDWRVDQDGLIYTDRTFKCELRTLCARLGLCGTDVDYSEQGMQGDNYVSCDVGEKFIASWVALRGKDTIEGVEAWGEDDDEGMDSDGIPYECEM